ncbi:MAG: radical SAM protein [Deltaproteobacteria bacterium]|nr:radical SAM protein [Deltaproteobacteria bacterium]
MNIYTKDSMIGVNNDWSLYDFYKLAVHGFPLNGIGSIDVTYRCNLNCKHCYYKKQNYHDELSLEEWGKKFEALKKEGFPFLICGWLGGEPLLRPELIELGKRYFKSNVIFTNGTIELPSWNDCTFSVSIHGTEPYYREITGAPKGTYERIKEQAQRRDIHMVISFCVTKVNFECIPDMLAEWSKTNAQKIVFEFYTPFKGGNNWLWLDWDERDRVLDLIKKLKKEYGDFIGLSYREIELMYSNKARQITSNCPFKEIGFTFDAKGNEKKPCAMGNFADCDRCGCILPFYSYVLTHRKVLWPEFMGGAYKRLKVLLRGFIENHKGNEVPSKGEIESSHFDNLSKLLDKSVDRLKMTTAILTENLKLKKLDKMVKQVGSRLHKK